MRQSILTCSRQSQNVSVTPATNGRNLPSPLCDDRRTESFSENVPGHEERYAFPRCLAERAKLKWKLRSLLLRKSPTSFQGDILFDVDP
jgi:hypothetical protein